MGNIFVEARAALVRKFAPPIVKAAPTRERLLLDRTAVAVVRAVRAYVRDASADDKMIERAQLGDTQGAMAHLEGHLEQLAVMLTRAFHHVGRETVRHLKLPAVVKAKPTVQASFNPGDPRAAAIAEQLAGEFLDDFGVDQLQALRNVLSNAYRQGYGTERIAQDVQRVIGLRTEDADKLTVTENAKLRARAEDMAFPEDQRPPIESDDMIARNLDTQGKRYLDYRSTLIARTESARIMGIGQDTGIRQSLASAGMDPALTIKEWVATRDGRTRDSHAAADGQRRRLDEPFDVGGARMMMPGEGPIEETANCRCTVQYHHADDIGERDRLLSEGT